MELLDVMKLLDEYMRIYGEEYLKKSPKIYKYIKRYFGEEYRSGEMLQVYGALGIYEECNPYREYFKLLEKYGFLSLKLLEIACGFYPILSKYIDEYHNAIIFMRILNYILKKLRIKEINSITAMDPMLVVKKLGNINLREESFNLCTDISKFDACIAIQPCEATEDIIDNAIPKNKDLFLALCDHPHFGDYEDGFYGGDYQMWEKYIYKLIERDLGADKVIIREELDEKYRRPYAIFIVISKKKADAVLNRNKLNHKVY
jgi:hypothetical protein